MQSVGEVVCCTVVLMFSVGLFLAMVGDTWPRFLLSYTDESGREQRKMGRALFVRSAASGHWERIPDGFTGSVHGEVRVRDFVLRYGQVGEFENTDVQVTSGMVTLCPINPFNWRILAA